MKDKLKYPLYLFVFILLGKVGYIIVESFYNYHVLTITTSPDLSKEILEELNTNGHRISAIGITLLLIPFLYLLVKNLHKFISPIVLIGISIGTYFIAYEGLNVVVNKIVEVNKEKRHDAYYVNIFKYGVLNNMFAYDSFIDHKKVENDTLDVNDRILLTNSFLLLSADENLIAKLKARGEGKAAEFYFNKNEDVQKDYQSKFESFKEASSEIKLLWEKFNSNRTKINNELQKNNSKDSVQKAYKDLTDKLTHQYQQYSDGSRDTIFKIREETHLKKITPIYNKLKTYFSYSALDKAKAIYKKTMIERFGYFVEPQEWLDENNDLTYASVAKRIEKEILSKAKSKMHGLPMGLSFKDFLIHDKFKLLLSEEMKTKGLLIPYDFDYSYEQFKKSYDLAHTKKYNEACNKFYEKVEKDIGPNDLKLDMDWNQFINSNFIRSSIKTKLKIEDNTTINNIVEAYRSKDLGNFKEMVFMPHIANKINDFIYTKEDFQDGGKAASKGDDAIRLLYIPPFALAVSILALLLNMITVLGMLLSLSGLNLIIQKVFKLLLLSLIILLPITTKYDSLNNSLINESTTGSTKIYLDLLKWIGYYENINSSIHEKPILTVKN